MRAISPISRYFAINMLSPADYYQQQKDKYSSELTAVTNKINVIARLRLLSIVTALVLGILAYTGNNNMEWWCTGIASVLFVILVRRNLALGAQKDTLELHLQIINNELLAVAGNFTSFPDGGAYLSAAHPYSYDLDLFGKGSVYQMLCRAVTNGGAALLAQRLQSLTLVKKDIEERQSIIKELGTQPELLQQFRVAGLAVPEGAKDQERVKGWLNGEDNFINNPLVRIAAVLMPALSVACIVWSVIIGTIFAGTSIVVLANWVLLGNFQKKIKAAVRQIGNSAALIDKYAGLLGTMAEASFTTPWLQLVSQSAKESVAEILKFKKLVHLFDSRSNGMVGPLMNTFFLFDFYCLLQLVGWRKKHSPLLLQAIDEMIAADVYVSGAVYAFNHPQNIYPQINDTGSEILATDLKHPLLSPVTAVGNDTSIGKDEQFYLLTGANMTGKSTFIRTIGVSNVMSNLGLPLPAKALSLPLLNLYTSMRITDSVQDDISYFRAELNRIKGIMDTVKASQQPYLVLLDEPLRGTNSTDKQEGTRAIAENLLSYNAIGIIATHDTGLCDMETNFPRKVRNYHFESRVEATGLAFDFKLRPGASTSNNATILMRQMGIVK